MPRPGWRIVCACATGTAHRLSGTPCQDAAAHAVLATDEGPVLVAVVCDGAGSAAHSDVGSRLASATMIELAEDHFRTGGRLVEIGRAEITGWIETLIERLTGQARLDGNPPKDYASTLLLALVGVNAAIFAQIGDGAIVVSHGEADGWSWVFWPQRGDYANQTVFVLSPGATETLDFTLAPRSVDEFALFSDGIERLVLHGATRAVNDSFFDHMLVPVRKTTAHGFDQKLSSDLERYLDSEAVNARTDDDKTLLIATRRHPGGLEP